jgi:hypothetical protein
MPRHNLAPTDTRRAHGGRRGHRQCGDVGRLVGARHLELHDAGVGEADVRGRLIRCATQHTFEHAPRAHDLIGLQRFERRASVDPGAMRRKQRLERIV